jgi:hypothetical protein
MNVIANVRLYEPPLLKKNKRSKDFLCHSLFGQVSMLGHLASQNSIAGHLDHR